VAEDVAGKGGCLSTLEIGSGSLNHLEYEPATNAYCVVEPLAELVANSPHRARVTEGYRDVEEIHTRRFDRIISIAAFEHYCDLPRIVAKCGRLLVPSGQLRVAIPSEGTILWALGWRLTTGIEFRLKHRLDYSILMRHEHVNTAEEIAAVLQIFFKKVNRTVLGISPAFSFYQFFQCADPDFDRCAAYPDCLTK